MPYAFLICRDAPATVGADPPRVAAVIALAEARRANGGLLGGKRSRPTTTAGAARVCGGAVASTDGSFATSNEQIAGIRLVNGKRRDGAIIAAFEIPAARHGAIEVWSAWEA